MSVPATGIAPAASLFDWELPSATMSTTTQLGDASIAASTSDITDGSVCGSGSGATPRQKGTERPARQPLAWISIQRIRMFEV